ncbi:MAG: DoxX family protein [Hyphomicrobiales bacterium]|nr:DoxX family protein [Hyphomicrobiales bacterium]
MSYKDIGREPAPLIGGLGNVYESIGALHWPLIRATAGVILFTHGWPKLMAGVQAVAAGTLAKRGIEPAVPLAYALIFLETVGAICITLGLLTRPFAVALVIEFLVIVYHPIPNGYAWVNRGWEYPLLWGLIFLAIAIRGGGPYSVDRAIGREV